VLGSFNLSWKDIIFLNLMAWWPCAVILILPIGFWIAGFLYYRKHRKP
jgi:hypothetical protein